MLPVFNNQETASERREVMPERNKHDASGQLSGYLYQVLSALLLLLDNKNPEAQLCIEKFDDVVFTKNDTPQTMIQIKHQLYKRGNLNDTSVDYWRTIKSWCDYISADQIAEEITKFAIITTAKARKDSAASYLQSSPQRDCDRALKIMRKTAFSNNPMTNESFYKAFKALDGKQQENLVKHIYIYDAAPTIADIKESIMPYVRMVTLKPFEERVYEKIIGWWIVNIIQCLISVNPVFISYRQLQKEMNDIGNEYKTDSLPIDVDPYYQPSEDELAQLPSEKRVFIEQLNLIAISHERLKRSIRDYYNAYCQRSQWVREQLLFINDLKKYEDKLVDEWERLFLIMKDDLKNYGNELSEAQKCTAGQLLFNKVENLELPIRKNVPDPFIMRGTYHELANQFAVGWHVDFMDRLCNLLKV